jgi:hypothetical protein
MKEPLLMSRSVFDALGVVLNEFDNVDLSDRLEYFKRSEFPEHHEEARRLEDAWNVLADWRNQQ